MRESSYAQVKAGIPNLKNADQTEERIGLRILAACAKVDINNKDQTALIDDHMPMQVMINGKRIPSSPSGLYLKLASIKIEEIERIELQDSSGKLPGFRLRLNFVLKK